MKIRLDRLGDEPYSWQETLSFSPDDLSSQDVLALSEAVCRGRISQTTPGFLLQVSLSYEQTLACTRCLGEIKAPAEGRLELLVTLEEGASSAGDLAGEHEIAADDLGILKLEEPSLDTGPLVAEQIQLNIPMKSLCRDNCAGLCPQCGADLNAGACDCQPTPDPRWQALAQLKQR